MSDDDRIAKLQALLARIRSRSREPRPAPARPPTRASAMEIATPVGAFHPSPLPPPPAPPTSAPEAPLRPKYTSRPEVPPGLFATRPPPYPPEPAWRRAPPNEPPPMEVVELEVDPDPSIPPPPVSTAAAADVPTAAASGPLPVEKPALESRSRLVSAPPMPLDSPLDELDSLTPLEAFDASDMLPAHTPSDPTIEVAAAEVSRAELEALEEEQAPTSSRRPISIDEKMSELDDDVAPLHTPPPESGRLPAASPTIELSFEPEPSLVREEIAFAVVREELPARPDVAVFVAAPRTDLGARTFGELLDEALSL